MKSFTVRVKFQGDVAYHKYGYDAPDMETAVKCGYDHAKSSKPGQSVVEYQV